VFDGDVVVASLVWRIGEELQRCVTKPAALGILAGGNDLQRIIQQEDVEVAVRARP
jgi:hypothetical protein